jgi:chromosome segregation ATPase
MTLHTKIYLAIAAACLLGGGLFVRTWLSEHDARIKAESDKAAQQVIINNAATDRAAHEKADAARDAQTLSIINGYRKTISMLKTPQQQIAWSQEQLKEALKGITVTLDSKGQAVATIPAASVPQLPQVIEQCKECTANLATAQADLASRAQQMKDADTQIKALQKTNGDLETQLKGGTVWQRTKKAISVSLCGGIGGIAGASASQNNRGRNAGIGAFAGGIACELILK